MWTCLLSNCFTDCMALKEFALYFHLREYCHDFSKDRSLPQSQFVLVNQPYSWHVEHIHTGYAHWITWKWDSRILWRPCLSIMVIDMKSISVPLPCDASSITRYMTSWVNSLPDQGRWNNLPEEIPHEEFSTPLPEELCEVSWVVNL
jgi:hypothetical protein